MKTTEDLSFADLICPHCHSGLLSDEGGLLCRSCGKKYPIIDGVPSFVPGEKYWCNVSRETMQKLNAKAKESGDWLGTARELIPQFVAHIEPFDRADAQFLFPVAGESRVLDAGAMWGGLTIPIAQHCGEVFAIDKTIETLMFLKIRAEQMGFRNVKVVASPVEQLPFPAGYFDLVILNGVLEWVAFDQDVVLEVHWGKRRQDSASYSKDPRQVQLEALREIRRVLKPGGYLYLAIENSIGYQYLAGAPDDHVNIRYVSFLPRFIANMITRWKLNCEYRTYTYSLMGYRSLLRNSGFSDVEFYGAFPHYILPSEIIPLNRIRYWKRAVLPAGNAAWYKKIAVKIFPAALLKYVSPSFIIIGRTAGGDEPKEARIVHLLRKAGLLADSLPSDIQVVKCGGRPGNYHAAHFLVQSKKALKPAYFCKICRDNRYSDILEYEANNLKIVNRLLKPTELSSSIPQLLYFGGSDSITFLVTQFIEGAPSRFNPGIGFTRDNLRKLDGSIQPAIRFLAKFQQYTQVREVEAAPYLLSIIEKQRGILKAKGRLAGEVDSLIKNLMQAIKGLEGLQLPICAIHGDYDFYCNILFDGDEVRTVDYEHFEPEGLPLLDLATLIFNPILMSRNASKSDAPLSSLIEKGNLMAYIDKWLSLYSDLSGMPMDVLRYFPQIAVLEQRTKEYPYYRNPETLPMYSEKAFIELLSLKMEL